jgi:demethylmenaquinone methyltransferase/2-methoxy-6-polyprenyl-1,4-benzoquinol methylase
MFDRIARHYDFLNHFLSLGIDVRWRKKAIRQLPEQKDGKVLDVATGTGDMAFMIARQFPGVTVTGVDIAEGMLKIAEEKLRRKGLAGRISFAQGDSENLRFEDNSFNAITVAFGVRNFEDLQMGLREMHRVVTPGGKAVILEFTKPRSFPFKQIFNGYFKHLLPFIGKLRSKDNRAYRYLYESVQAFPDYDRFSQELLAAGWKDPEFKSLTLGICAIYTATK